MRSKKGILDTNLWISFLISRRLDEIDDLLNEGKIKLIFSKELVEEFLTVIKRPKLKNISLTTTYTIYLGCLINMAN